MSPETKQAIIDGLKADLGNAGDNLYRAIAAFRKCPEDEMRQKYGQSDQTRQEILDGYQRWYDAAKKALEEAEASL